MKTTIEVTVEVEVEYTVQHDPKYGADADGNRGVDSWWVEDVEVVNKESILKQVELAVANEDLPLEDDPDAGRVK